jgi:lipopolysaccharide export system permease protein
VKKVHLLILKSFIRPFIVTFSIVMFVLLMLFLFKYIDDLIGKGFAWYTIAELMMYASATNVAMALPLSVLLSTIMTYGALGENYELVAIKSAGISLSRAMYPMMIVVSLLSIAAFLFSDYMLPVANLKYFSLLYDVRQQRSATLLPQGVFSNSFPGYTIRVEKKDPNGQNLYGITIYQKDLQYNNNSVIFAKEGFAYRTVGDQYLVLKLKDGIRYEETPGDQNSFNTRQRMTRFRFHDMEQKFDMSVFQIKRTPQGLFKSSYQMMDIKQLRDFQKATRYSMDSLLKTQFRLISPFIRYFVMPKKSAVVKNYLPVDSLQHKIWLVSRMDTTNVNYKLNQQLSAFSSASSEARSIQGVIKNNVVNTEGQDSNIRHSEVEYQKKYTLSAVCLVLFLIGAPLGAIIRKGGLGLPVVVSVIFFVLYYIISTIGEKSVKDGSMPPILGMWIAIFILIPVGIFLSYKAATDSTLFDMEVYKRFFNKLLKRKEA